MFFMTVGDLKAILKDKPEDMSVLIPLNAGNGFDGAWFSPCIEESGEIELGLEDLDEDEIKERELLNIPFEKESSIALVPCGFFQPHEGPPVELN